MQFQPKTNAQLAESGLLPAGEYEFAIQTDGGLVRSTVFEGGAMVRVEITRQAASGFMKQRALASHRCPTCGTAREGDLDLYGGVPA